MHNVYFKWLDALSLCLEANTIFDRFAETESLSLASRTRSQGKADNHESLTKHIECLVGMCSRVFTLSCLDDALR